MSARPRSTDARGPRGLACPRDAERRRAPTPIAERPFTHSMLEALRFYGHPLVARKELETPRELVREALAARGLVESGDVLAPITDAGRAKLREYGLDELADRSLGIEPGEATIAAIADATGGRS